MLEGNSIVCLCVVATLAHRVMGDVVIETKRNFRPFRIYEDLPARFGDALPEDGLVGYLVQAHPIDACSPIAPPPAIDPEPGIPPLHWIAIIRRSEAEAGGGKECTFQDKVKAAMVANYSAAIIYNYKNDELIPMGGDSDDLIPSVFIGFSDGNKILEHYTYFVGRGDYVVRITDNAPFDINAYLLPFAIVVGICFIIMLGIMVFKCIQDRRRERRHRLPKSSLKKIPTKKFVAGDEVHYETCCICLDDYTIGDKLRILPCDHAYHIKCIDPWLLKNKRVCPQCRKKVFASGEVPPSDSESETEDERAPLLARPRNVASGTFQMQNENPFRRAARRLASRRSLTETGSSHSGEMSDSTEEGEESDDHRDHPAIMGNQLLAEVHIEQPRTQRGDSPTFERGGGDMERVYSHQTEGRSGASSPDVVV
jgi:E3 ubiquitin-protein ligase RNF13